jgi:hypothetical protein
MTFLTFSENEPARKARTALLSLMRASRVALLTPALLRGRAQP